MWQHVLIGFNILHCWWVRKVEHLWLARVLVTFRLNLAILSMSFTLDASKTMIDFLLLCRIYCWGIWWLRTGTEIELRDKFCPIYEFSLLFEVIHSKVIDIVLILVIQPREVLSCCWVFFALARKKSYFMVWLKYSFIFMAITFC